MSGFMVSIDDALNLLLDEGVGRYKGLFLRAIDAIVRNYASLLLGDRVRKTPASQFSHLFKKHEKTCVVITVNFLIVAL